ncbi:uncharacterized protein LOC112890646 [Panicum hallii]|uniref:uncharacterized protein LOC112890646 n=1 Tax=Panicum hallii TaxID=206008 RepID=UPI000DF4E033|nr:uncharacterized protein LOC112890646 [Panicum hallii]
MIHVPANIWYEKLVAGVAESASALTLQEPDVSYSGVLLDYTSSEESTTDSDDDSAQSASSFLEKDNYSIVDRLIHEHNYYPDGMPKRGPKSQRRTNPNEEQHHLVQALLDQYNDDNNLFGNRAHALESLLRHEYEKNKWYYHFNFTTKTGNLFFAEVSQRQGERAWKVNCCCIVDCNENGQCNGYRNNGGPDMNHPNNTDAYTAGLLDGYLPFGDGELSGFDDLEAEAARLRVVFKGLDDPDATKRLRLRAMQQQ